MKSLKKLVLAAAFTFAVCVPVAQAQPQAAPAGIFDCVTQKVQCLLSGEGIVTCAIQFVTCLAGGGGSSSVAMIDPRR